MRPLGRIDQRHELGGDQAGAAERVGQRLAALGRSPRSIQRALHDGRKVGGLRQPGERVGHGAFRGDQRAEHSQHEALSVPAIEPAEERQVPPHLGAGY